jgi:hypothetical protein
MTSLPTYIVRRTAMTTPLGEQLARVMVRERQLRAEADSTAHRLITVRRWQRIVYKTR